MPQPRFVSMVTTATRLVATVAMWAVIACAILAQTPPKPGPTVPEKSLPVPKGGENIVINPTAAECKAGWRPGMRWTKEQFDAFCRQFEISK
jgi:hypothetical protein